MTLFGRSDWTRTKYNDCRLLITCPVPNTSTSNYLITVRSRNITTLSRNHHPWGETTRWTSPMTDLFNHFLVLLYRGSFQLNHLTRDDWIDLKQLCIDWYFPGQMAIIIRKFCDLRHCRLPPLQQLLVLSVHTQQIIRRLNWEEEQRSKVHLIQIEESDEENCVKDDST